MLKIHSFEKKKQKNILSILDWVYYGAVPQWLAPKRGALGILQIPNRNPIETSWEILKPP